MLDDTDSKQIREWFYNRRLGYCFYCGIPVSISGRFYTKMVLDHFIPRSKGGSDRITNRVPSCDPCNNAKADGEPDLTKKFGPNAKQRQKNRDKVRAIRNGLFVAIYRDFKEQHTADRKIRA